VPALSLARRVLARRVGFVAALILGIAWCATVALAAPTSDTCKLIGMSTKVADQTYGKHANYKFFPANDADGVTPYCQISPSATSEISRAVPYPEAALRVFLYPSSQFSSLVSQAESTQKSPTYSKFTVTHLPSLGNGAVYVVSRNHAIDRLIFPRGPYAVMLENSEAGSDGGVPNSLYPSEKQYVIIARCAHAHLH
jgi:hypothetical protein